MTEVGEANPSTLNHLGHEDAGLPGVLSDQGESKEKMLQVISNTDKNSEVVPEEFQINCISRWESSAV